MLYLKSIVNYLIKNERFLFILLFILVILERILVFFKFSSVYTDSDQTLIWQVAKDMMQGIFHGPCFYGQSYNPNFEPLFALPFLFLGLDFYTALPLTTSILGIAPFLILAYYLFKKSEPYTGLIPLFVVLLLAPEYGMLSTISRGFVSGIFFATIGMVLLLFQPSFIARFLGATLMGIGFYANPNCFFLFPLLLPFLWENRKNLLKVIWPVALGLIMGSSLLLLNAIYYDHHPELVIHASPKMQISFHNLIQVLGQLDNYFDFISPIFWRFGWVSLGLFILTGIRLWRKGKRIYFATLSLIFLLILSSFTFSKVIDGTNSVFFSGSRMYLAYPFVLVFIAIYFLDTLNKSQKERSVTVLIVLTGILLPIKMIGYNFFLNNALSGNKNAVVQVISIDQLRYSCNEITNNGQEKIDILIANSGNTPDQPIAYGCPCLYPDFPHTLIPLYERRVWLMSDRMNRTYNRVMIYGGDSNKWREMKLEGLQILKADKNRSRVLIDNKLKTSDLLKEIGIKMD